jgi:PAS domain S-box-containing protein
LRRASGFRDDRQESTVDFSMTRNTARTLWLPAAQTLLGSTGVAGLTYICYRLHLGVATTALLDLVVVVLLSLTGSFAASAVVSLVATLCLHYFFITPRFSWRIDDLLDIVALAAFLTTTLVITRLLSKVRESLREVQIARDQLRLAIDTIPAMVWTTLPDGSSELSNQRWLEYTGLSRDEAREWGYTSAIHPEDYERLLPKWSASFTSGETIEDEARLRRSDGEYRWFLHRAVPLRDERGTIVKWYGTSFDIEDRKRAKEVLREQARLLDLTHDTVFVRDMDDVITYWNRGAEERYGWTREEAIGQVSHQLMRTIFPAPVEKLTAALLRDGRWEGELVHTKRDGTRVVVSSRWSLQRDEEGAAVATLETNNDITERKRAEDALRRSEAYLAEAQRLSHTGSFGWDVASGALNWSDETFRIFEHDPAHTKPSMDLVLQRVHPEDAAIVQQRIEHARREEKDWDLDHRLLMPDGSVKYVHVVARARHDEPGKLEFLGAVMDVTAARRAQEALRRARERALKARFAAVLDERTRLAREIHDTLLQGFTGVALKLVAATNRLTGPPETAAALRDVVSLAQKTLGDARRAVWDLRAPSLASGDFPTAVRAAAENCVRGTGLTLEYAMEGPPRPVDPDIEATAVRVVQEAVTNALKHADACTVRLKLSFEARGVRLSVRDDGRGFAVDPDFQAYGGHWGLLGMRERATQVHGKLRVRSTPGQGTEVALLVPYAARRGSRPRPASITTP